MADGRQRAEWGRIASLAAQIHLTFTGEALDPEKMMPERYRARTVPKTPAQEEHEGRSAWRLLDSAFNPDGK